MVEEDVEPLLGVDDVGLEGGWRPRLHALHVLAEDLVDGARGRGNMVPVAGGVFGRGGGGRCGWLGSSLWWRS